MCYVVVLAECAAQVASREEDGAAAVVALDAGFWGFMLVDGTLFIHLFAYLSVYLYVYEAS